DQDFGEYRLEGGEDGAKAGEGELVGLQPLAEDAVGAEAPVRQPVEVAREDVRHPRDPGMRRLRDDHVVALVGGEEDVAGVVPGGPAPGGGRRVVSDVQGEAADLPGRR